MRLNGSSRNQVRNGEEGREKQSSKPFFLESKPPRKITVKSLSHRVVSFNTDGERSDLIERQGGMNLLNDANDKRVCELSNSLSDTSPNRRTLHNIPCLNNPRRVSPAHRTEAAKTRNRMEKRTIFDLIPTKTLAASLTFPRRFGIHIRVNMTNDDSARV